MMEQRSEKYAVVTGGSRGIGLAVARRLTDMGYFCLIAARRPTAEALELVASGKAEFLSCDISDKADRLRLRDAMEKNGGVGLAVMCAGVAPKVRRDMLEITEEDFDAVLDINQKGTFFTAQAAANIMREKRRGRIVFISSVSSYTASVERAEYCVSKASISMFTKLFAARLAEYGISVFEVSPGIIETDMTAVVKDKYVRLIDAGLTPVKRMGQPADVADAVAACAGGELDFCTGTVINADGGFSVRRL